MDILDYAMKMEQDGVRYYLENAEKVRDKNAARFFGFLAREEKRHFEIFKSYQAGISEKPDSSFVKEVKTLFQAMKERGESFREEDGKIVEVLNHGLEIENKSINYYVQKLNETQDAKLRDILFFIKKEEDKHYSILSNLIDYYMRPQTWLEQGEFTHLDNY